MRRAVVVALIAACGDNALPDGVALAPTHDLVVVAHQADDLLFMQPDVIEAVQRGAGVTSVYVTAGDGTRAAEDAEPRYAGLRAAYGAAAGRADWACGWIEIAAHLAEHCRLAEANVSLVFLAYPDGGTVGERPSSLLQLWEGAIDGADTVSPRPTHYTRDDLVETIAEIIRETQPATVRTLEIAATHGRDHSDHMIVGALALLAVARAGSRAELVSYRGDNIADEPVNKIDPIYAAAFAILARYEACATGCAPCGQPCTTIDPTHEAWLHGRYAVGFRSRATGLLQTGMQCLSANASSTLSLGDCASAPLWTLDTYGQLHVDMRCLETLPTGELVAGDCAGGSPRRFFVDDEAHIWAGVPPAAAPDMDYAHLWCLVPSAGRARAELCGQAVAPLWTFVPPVVSTTRSSLGIAATGRAVRLGDLTGDGKADLCAVGPGGLSCAAGDGAGGFAPATRIDVPAAPLAIDPDSLAIGDIDGDGKPDACGRAIDGSGILCATAATGFVATPWTMAFGGDAIVGTGESLAIVEVDGPGTAGICGLAADGVMCAVHDGPPILRSAEPGEGNYPGTDIWAADLDGDRRADWCGLHFYFDSQGPIPVGCGVVAEADVTTYEAPWAFALGGKFEYTPFDFATTALADVDGDGRADLCSLQGDRVACARSQGRSFGPQTTLAILPGGTALWLGDLDGDGRADACVDAGGSIQCALGP